MFTDLFGPEQIAILTQIIFIELVLAGDNAIIIGMVASKFPVEQRKKIIFWGIGGAVILRIILTLLTAYLLQITGLRLIGGLLLLYIVYKLYTDVIKVNNILKITAALIPQNIIFFLLSGSNFEATIPIIIALSPARTRSIKMICPNIVNCSGVNNSANIIFLVSYQHLFLQSL